MTTQLPYEQRLAAGTFASVMAVVFVTPLDVVKTRLQAQDSLSKDRFTGSLHAFREIARKEGIKTLWRGSIPTLWASLPSVAMYMATYDEFKLRMLGVSRGLGPQYQSWLDPYVPAVAGLSARTIVVTIVSPMELARTQMQAKPGCSSAHVVHVEPGCSPPTMTSVLRRVVQQGGVSALWRGLPPTLARDIPFSAAYWTCVESFRPMLEAAAERCGLWRHHHVSSDGCGSVDTVGAAVDVVDAKVHVVVREAKMRRDHNWNGHDDSGSSSSSNISGGSSVSDDSRSSRNDNNNIIDDQDQQKQHQQQQGATRRYNATQQQLQASTGHVLAINTAAGGLAGMTASILSHPFDVIKTHVQTSSTPVPFIRAATAIHRKDGVLGFFRGLVPRTFKIMPGCAVVLASYEAVKYLMELV